MEQLVERISVADSSDDVILNVCGSKALVRLSFDEIGDLVVFLFNYGIYIDKFMVISLFN